MRVRAFPYTWMRFQDAYFGPSLPVRTSYQDNPHIDSHIRALPGIGTHRAWAFKERVVSQRYWRVRPLQYGARP